MYNFIKKFTNKEPKYLEIPIVCDNDNFKMKKSNTITDELVSPFVYDVGFDNNIKPTEVRSIYSYIGQKNEKRDLDIYSMNPKNNINTLVNISNRKIDLFEARIHYLFTNLLYSTINSIIHTLQYEFECIELFKQFPNIFSIEDLYNIYCGTAANVYEYDNVDCTKQETISKINYLTNEKAELYTAHLGGYVYDKLFNLLVAEVSPNEMNTIMESIIPSLLDFKEGCKMVFIQLCADYSEFYPIIDVIQSKIDSVQTRTNDF